MATKTKPKPPPLELESNEIDSSSEEETSPEIEAEAETVVAKRHTPPDQPETTDWTIVDGINTRHLWIIAVQAHENPNRGWSLTASHGEPPRGFYATLNDAKGAGDRHMRAHLERTLSELTKVEDLPRSSGRPRPCGVVLLYPDEEVGDKRKIVLNALMKVS